MEAMIATHTHRMNNSGENLMKNILPENSSSGNLSVTSALNKEKEE